MSLEKSIKIHTCILGDIAELIIRPIVDICINRQ